MQTSYDQAGQVFSGKQLKPKHAEHSCTCIDICAKDERHDIIRTTASVNLNLRHKLEASTASVSQYTGTQSAT